MKRKRPTERAEERSEMGMKKAVVSHLTEDVAEAKKHMAKDKKLAARVKES
jgi:hypothetical protein